MRGEDFTPVSRDFRIRAAAYVGILAAYLSGSQDDPFTAGQLVFFGLAAGWSLAFEHRFLRPFFPAPLKIGLVIVGSVIFVGFLSAGERGSAGHFANMIARFLFWNAVVFILSRGKTEYDLWTLSIINMSLFMISAAFVQPADFVPLLLVSLASFLYVFHRHALLRCGPAARNEKVSPGLPVMTILLSLELAVIVFLLFPRQAFHPGGAGNGLLPGELPPEGAPTASTDARTGHPRTPGGFNLTQYHRLKKDTAQVLHLKVTGQGGRPVDPYAIPYLRGATVDVYRDGRWSTAFDRRPVGDTADGIIDGWTPLAPPHEGWPTVRQLIRMNAISEDLAFAIPDAVRVHLPEARYDPAGTVFFAGVPRQIVQYEIESSLMPIGDVPRVDAAGVAVARYLQLPAGLDRLRALVRDHRDALKAGGVHTIARHWEEYLMRNGFSYRVEPFVPTPGTDAVEHFLFEKRSGYCTHYATALALLCRASGVPARVATGYQLHHPTADGTYLVRSSDAHAWVEVWFGPDHGWRAYDATPPEGRAPAAGPELGAPVATPEGGDRGTAGEDPNRAWDAFIRDFDRSTQSKALTTTLLALGDAAGWLFSPAAAAALMVLVTVLVLVYALLPGGGRRRLRQAVSGFRERTTIPFYRDFLWALARRGIRKPASQTPREFARQARLRLADEGIDFVTDRFYETRYGGRPPGPEDARRIEEIIRRLLKPASDPKPSP